MQKMKIEIYFMNSHLNKYLITLYLVMQIFVKNLNGKTTTIDVEESFTVLQLKGLIAEKEGISVADQRLIFEGRQLEDSRLLSEHGIVEMSTVHLVLRLQGGIM
jgi:ubiquitin